MVAIMQGNTDQHQLTLIAQLCGAISPEVWPNVESLDLFNRVEIPRGVKRRVKERLKPYVKVSLQAQYNLVPIVDIFVIT